MPNPCTCKEPSHTPRLVVVTGGPSAGKTAVLEVVQRHFCPHVTVLPEAASILFRGGFPRQGTPEGRRAAQRSIFAVERELEGLALARTDCAVVLCDRGTLDGLAYWPDGEPSFSRALGIDREQELARYASVIHLRTPVGAGYDHSNPIRIEGVSEAAEIDERIVKAWDGHPNRTFIESSDDFLDKIRRAVDRIRQEVPTCCRTRAFDGPF